MYRQSEKNLLSSNISFRCSHNMANFGQLTAEICWQVWGTPANFNGFCVLASLLQRRRSPKANQTLHDVWPSPGLVRYIYTFGGSCPLTEFCPVQNRCKIHFTSKSCVLVYWQRYCTTLQTTNFFRVVQATELRNFRRGRHLYSAGRPSRWASAHISSLIFLWSPYAIGQTIIFLISSFLLLLLFYLA